MHSAHSSPATRSRGIPDRVLEDFSRFFVSEAGSGRYRSIWVKLNPACSVGCNFCSIKGSTPKPSIPGPMPFELARTISEEYSKSRLYGGLPLYLNWDSDPLEYPWIRELCFGFREQGNDAIRNVVVSTAAPEKHTFALLDLIRDFSGTGLNIRISLSQANEARLVLGARLSDILRQCKMNKIERIVFFVRIQKEELDKNGFFGIRALADKKAKTLADAKFVWDSTGFLRNPFLNDCRLFHLLKTKDAVVFYQHGTANWDPAKLPVFSNLIDFSDAVVSGILREGEPFLMQCWPNGLSYSNENRKGLFITPVDWTLEPIGKLFSPGTLRPHSFYMRAPELVILTDGSMYKVRTVVPSENCKTGKEFELIRRPISSQ
jgi:hypothetical protein